jgi:hypothetical protein
LAAILRHVGNSLTRQCNPWRPGMQWDI